MHTNVARCTFGVAYPTLFTRLVSLCEIIGRSYSRARVHATVYPHVCMRAYVRAGRAGGRECVSTCVQARVSTGRVKFNRPTTKTGAVSIDNGQCWTQCGTYYRGAAATPLSRSRYGRPENGGRMERKKKEKKKKKKEEEKREKKGQN